MYKKLLILAGNTFRARAYIQAIENSKIKLELEITVILYGSVSKKLQNIKINTETSQYLKNNKIFKPNLNLDLVTFLENNNWNYKIISENNVNSETIINSIQKQNPDLIVYAGYGGQILAKEHFESGKNYIHMHPGDLPSERGSTTIYYSILNKKKCTVTSFYMTERIDDGSHILKKQYNTPDFGVDIDYWFDNSIRADCLIETLEKIIKNKGFKHLLDQNVKCDVKEKEYYIIHPVLKHLSILSLKK